MFCRNCKFHHGGFMWNRCDLTDSECYREYIDRPCDIVDDSYKFREDCEFLGFVKGASAIEYMKGA